MKGPKRRGEEIERWQKKKCSTERFSFCDSIRARRGLRSLNPGGRAGQTGVSDSEE